MAIKKLKKMKVRTTTERARATKKASPQASREAKRIQTQVAPRVNTF
jgi:hypothetical protein